MTLRSRHVKHARRIKALQWTVALAMGASLCAGAQAARLGHSRVVSPPGAPLQVVVPLQDLTSEEIASLRVSLADEAAWQRAGLQPPTPLASTRLTVEDGADTTRKIVRIVSTQPLTTSEVDLLLELRSSAGQRQVQITILVPPRGSAAPVQPATTGSASSAPTAPADTVRVRRGDYLFDIAQRNAVAQASVYQMLVAFWQVNPRAFIQNNMNLVRAGETLVIPDAATVQAIDPAQARRIFAEQAEAFTRYRGRAGALAAGDAPVASDSGAGGGRVGAAAPRAVPGSSSAQDRLRLSSAAQGAPGASDAQADARTSDQRALQEAQRRVETLQGNVEALSRAAGTPGAADTSGATDTPGAAGTSDAAGKPGASGATDATGAATMPAPSPRPDAARSEAPANDNPMDANMPAWLADNLLVIVTAALALIVFIIAWLLRRAGARRADEDEQSYGYGEPVLDAAIINRKLDTINLDLDQPPTDEPHPGRRRT